MTDPTKPGADEQSFNMAAYCIGRAAHAVPGKAALLVVDSPDASAPPAETWSYAALQDSVLRVAAGLADLGLRRGDRLIIRLDNTSSYALLFFGAVAAGIVPVPTSSQLTEEEARFVVVDSGAAAIAEAPHLAVPDLPADVRRIDAETVAELLRYPSSADWAETSPEDPAFLVYTSGTTANPKGVLHAHRSALGRRPMVAGWYGLSSADRVLHAGAFNWTYTLGTGLTDPWANGATAIVYVGEKDPALWPRIIAGTQATIFAAVPSLYRQMLKYGAPTRDGLGRLRHGLIAGETPPPGLFEDWTAATGRELYEALGQSEVSTYISSSPAVPRKPGRVGRPQEGRRVAILPVDAALPGNDATRPVPLGEDGLIAVHRSDPGLMLGYWNRPDEEAEVWRGDWFVGGDIGRMDEDGYITHLGRGNDIMKALGYRVAPQEVEAVLARCPGVAEVACREVQVRADVSVIGAFVVPADPAHPPAADDVLAFAAAHLASYKCPRQVTIVATLPRTANGKVKRSALG